MPEQVQAVSPQLRRRCRWFAMGLVVGLLTTAFSLSAYADKGLTGQPVPASTLKALDGNNLKLPLVDANLTIVDFWASWCKPCLVQMESLAVLHEKYARYGLRVLAVNAGEEDKLVHSFIRRRALPFTFALADRQAMQEWGNIRGIPRMFLVDRKGVVRLDHMGLMPLGQLEPLVRKHLQLDTAGEQ
jgi:thiol-disulfide isomerase/thioredoxin